MSSSFTEFPEEILLEVNRVCNRFETAWRAGEDPNLKAALEELPEKYRGAALLELLPIDVEWRRRSQLPIDVDGYCQRFPGVDRERIAEICGGASSDNSVSDTAATPSSTQKRTRTTEDIPRTIGDYEIVDQIGQGGMGAVYRAVHVRMDRTVALKVIQPEIAKDPQLIQRFEREVRVAAKLTHPNIVAALDAREEDGIYCLITEFIDGQDLNTLVKKNGPMSVSAVVDVLIQAATGLEYAHQRGVIHRDIKPANVIFGEQGQAILTDFGIAKLMTHDLQLTATQAMVGTPNYMAPEFGLG
ncbi:MAG: serine/threonine protein kinase, partial [Planctomycetaceae bacterium]|nr:serine/threonine protein kinase [Planctomycetaceae bacterium]